MQKNLNIVLIKTSSLGDVLHNLPVVTDIQQHFPEAAIDWVVEENFATLPLLHSGVQRVVPVAIRRWRKSWWNARQEIKAVRHELRERHYDLALDTQGLLKSAVLSYFTHTIRCGYDRQSAREPLASLFYNRTFPVAKNLHAVERNRQLAALALGYELHTQADYGIAIPDLHLEWLPDLFYIVLLHATSRDDKLWDENNWIKLGAQLHQAGFRTVLPWGSEKEKLRSERLHAAIPGSIVPPYLHLNEATTLMGRAQAVVGVDTGLSHLAAAVKTPTIGIYTATDPGLTGLYAGDKAINLGGKGMPPNVDDVITTLKKLGIYA